MAKSTENKISLPERIKMMGGNNVAVILRMMVDDIDEIRKEVEQLKEALKDGTYCLG